MGNGYKEVSVSLEPNLPTNSDELNYFTAKPISRLISLFEWLADGFNELAKCRARFGFLSMEGLRSGEHTVCTYFCRTSWA